MNISNIIRKFGYNSKFLSLSLFGLYKVDSEAVNPIMPVEKLEYLNSLAEDGRLFKFALEFLKDKELRKYIFKLKPKNLMSSLRKLNIFYISIGNIHQPINFLHRLADTIDFQKIKGKLKMSVLLNYTGGSDGG